MHGNQNPTKYTAKRFEKTFKRKTVYFEAYNKWESGDLWIVRRQKDAEEFHWYFPNHDERMGLVSVQRKEANTFIGNEIIGGCPTSHQAEQFL